MEEKTRTIIEQELWNTLGDTEHTAVLIDYIKELWETADLLREAFGPERAHAIIHAPAFLPSPLREVMVV